MSLRESQASADTVLRAWASRVTAKYYRGVSEPLHRLELGAELGPNQSYRQFASRCNALGVAYSLPCVVLNVVS